MITAIIIFAILLFFFDIYQRFYKPKIGTRTWPQLAALTGLAYKPPTGPWSNRSQPHVAGKYREHQLKLDIVKVAHGVIDDGIALYCTRIVLSLNGKIDGSVALSRRWFFGSGEGVQIGDEEFDRRFIVKSRPADFAAQAFASADLRQRLLQTHMLKFRVSDLGLHFEKSGVEQDIERLRSLFDLLCDIAESAEQAAQGK